MTAADEVIAAFYRHLKNRDQEALHGLLADDMVVEYHAQPDAFPWSGTFPGKAGFDRFFDIIRAHLDVVEVSVVRSISGSSEVVNLCRGKWRYRENGRLVEGDMVNVFSVRNGKIDRYDVYADTQAFADGMPGGS